MIPLPSLSLGFSRELRGEGGDVTFQPANLRAFSSGFGNTSLIVIGVVAVLGTLILVRG
ncbi:MAG: hypothetical protein AAFR21_15790 [Pseudomonadota bacterium]